MKSNNSYLAFSFSKGFMSPNIPIATFNQGSKELNFIIDTGSDENVIDKESLKDIKYEMVEDKSTLAGVGGVYQVDACNITFNLGDDTFTTKFLISEHLQEAFNNLREAHAIQLHGMLGSNFLRSNNIVLNFNNLTAYNQK